MELLRLMLLSKKRVKAPSAPTGFGKTAVYVAYALMTGQPTCFVTESRGLQDQIMRDFESVGMVDIRGRRNYECHMRPDYTCEEGYAASCPHKGRMSCPSSQAEVRASLSPLVVTNYDKWTASKRFGTGLDHIKQVVLDEGHTAPDALARAMQVILGNREIDELDLAFPPSSEAEEFVNWKGWAAAARQVAEARMIEAKARIAGLRDPKPSWVRAYTHLKNLTRRLAIIATANPDNWIVDAIEKGYQFDPVRPGRYAEATLLLRIPSIVVISATLRPKTLHMIGVGKDNYEFWEFPSEFPAGRCPIYYVPTMRVDKRATDLSLLWVRLDQIAARRTDRKGIVHTISYSRRDEILARSRFASHMLINQRGEASTDMVEQFKDSPPGAILVSPSVGAGFDFPDRDCEWQFVCKIPFPDSRQKIVQARQADDPEYGPYQAINKLVQIFGRGMRHKADQCENFIADEHLDWFLPRWGWLAPKWFHGFFRRVSILPSPPPRL